jgi:GAF domain-containing protein
MSQMLDDTVADLRRANAELQQKLDARTAELSEALEQQTATAEVLQVINSSPGDLTPVFNAMLEKAMHLCEAAFGMLWTYDGECLHAVAMHGVPRAFADFAREPLRPGLETGLGRVLRGERLIHIADIKAGEAYRSGDRLRVATVELAGARTLLLVPLRKDDALLGIFSIYRQEVRPFTDKQIALLQNFAAQAVIAMENARLITETREALEQQTATAEVLEVINSSPGDLVPVFDAILEKAHALCEAAFGTLMIRDGQRFYAAVLRGVPAPFEEVLRRGFEPHPGTPLSRLLCGEPLIHIFDLAQVAPLLPDDSVPRAGVELGGTRTLLMVPLVRDEELLGVISAYRQEVRPFTDKQIGLLQNFAAQAVIAMENARLLGELRQRTDDLQESLDYQTATSDVLKVISRSTFDLQPVFETIVETATRLCEADSANITNREGEALRVVATFAISPEHDSFLRSRLLPIGRGSIAGRAALERQVVHIHDIAADPEYTMTEAVTLAKRRTLLGVPLLREGVVVGTINLGRQRVQPFTDRQIELVRTFADQAVIALENARLITETREALDQQTATNEVLEVINSSPGDLAPVFETMLEKAMRLCTAAFGYLLTYDGERFQTVAHHGLPPRFAEYLPRMDQPGSTGAYARILGGAPLVHVTDLMDEDVYRTSSLRQALVDLGGARTGLIVALRKEEALLGILTIYRQEVRPFSDKQVALLQNFAAQAVIAMENARLITETREALEQQTATAEVLQVINSSPGDLAPVFDAILEKAHSLCGAAFGALLAYEGEHLHAVATHGVPEPFAAIIRRTFSLHSDNPVMRLIRGEERLVHIPDLAEVDARLPADPVRRAAVGLGGIRTLLVVPLRKDNTVLGVITAYRQEVRLFSDKQIALLQNFAAQAVIAMENARLLTETREALEQQTATAQVLQVINSSPGDLAPVFDAMLEKALTLCGAAFGILWTYDGEMFHAAALQGVPSTAADLFTRGPHPVGPDNTHGILLRGDPVVHITDAAATEAYRSGDPLRRAVVDLSGARTLLGVPMRKDGVLLGAFDIYRQEVRPFSEREIALLQNFAAQAVIAMENARLLDQIRQRQAELRTTFDNMADGVAMFDEDLRLTAWNRNFQELLDLPDALLSERPNYADYVRILADRGEFGTEDIEAELSRRLEHIDQELRLERTRPDGRVIGYAAMRCRMAGSCSSTATSQSASDPRPRSGTLGTPPKPPIAT